MRTRADIPTGADKIKLLLLRGKQRKNSPSIAWIFQGPHDGLAQVGWGVG
jgi:hypothetical protein